MITAEHIIKTIEDKGLQQQFFDSDYWEDVEDLEDFDNDEVKYLESLGLPTEYKKVAGRCDTSEFWAVINFPAEDIFIKITGEYDSYGQYEHQYDHKVKQVFPKQVTQTEYK